MVACPTDGAWTNPRLSAVVSTRRPSTQPKPPMCSAFDPAERIESSRRVASDVCQASTRCEHKSIVSATRRCSSAVGVPDARSRLEMKDASCAVIGFCASSLRGRSARKSAIERRPEIGAYGREA